MSCRIHTYKLKSQIKTVAHSLWTTDADGRIGFYRGYAFINLLHEEKYKTMYSDYHSDEEAALEDLLAKLKKAQDMACEDTSLDPYDIMTK